MIEFTCANCGNVLKVPDAAAGKKGTCPMCGGLCSVPTAEAQEDTRDDVSTDDGE